MTLRHFQIFQTVCRLESITLAAEKLNMSQPAVSMAVKELESFYHTQLFERMNRRIYITEAGRMLLQYANNTLAQYQESIDVIRNASNFHKCGIGVNVTIGETKLPRLIQQIRQDIPDIDLSVCIANSQTIEAKIRNNEIDFAILDSVSDSPEWKRQLLFRENMVIIGSPEYVAKCSVNSIEELAREHLLLRETGSGSRDSIDAVLKKHGLTANAKVEGISTASLVGLAENGLGLAILSPDLVSRQIQEGTLQQLTICDDCFERNFYLVYHNKKILSQTMKSVIETVIRYFQKNEQSL